MAKRHRPQVVMVGGEGRVVYKHPVVEFQFDADNPELTVVMWISPCKGTKRIFFGVGEGKELMLKFDPEHEGSGYLVLKPEGKRKRKKH